ncbi:MAG: hybrid sensor histidine kinase/response regulator [Pseudomonadota bacterium]|nr:hybrid sensor histidine kinase/response regulator [Pseudomonadota bacterium]
MRFQFSGGAWRHGLIPTFPRYLFGIFLFLVALAARFMLLDVLPARGFPFLSFFPAVLLTAYMVGLGPGLLVAVLSTLSAWAFFMGPTGMSFALERSDIIALVFFAVILVIDCLVIERMNAALSALRTTGDKLRASETVLLEQQDQLRDVDRQKDTFIAMLAHELRNPLAPILSAAQLISAHPTTDAHVARAAAIVTRQALQLKRLVDDLLDASRIHSAKLVLKMAVVDVRAVIASALETVQPMVDLSASTLRVDLPMQPVWVHADSTRIAQCVANLLHNAFKFTPGAGHVELHVAYGAEDTVVITVKDSGRGISAEMLPRLFEMFAQEGASGSDGNNGLGIGLALTNYLVTQHSGTLAAYSAGPGLGARFSITLPTVAAVTASITSTTSISIDPPLSSEPALAVSTTRVLVVDDNVDAAEMLQVLLDMHGIAVEIAHNGTVALEMIGASHWDAILLDIGLPDMSGYDVAIASRSRHLLAADTLLIALTGWSDAESLRKSSEAGFLHHLNKPVQLDLLLSLLQGKSGHSTQN